MNQSSCSILLPKIRDQFSAMWSCRQRSDSVIEIRTPFHTVTRRFVSVFIEQIGQEWVVSDGGWLRDEMNRYDLSQTVAEDRVEYLFEICRFKYSLSFTPSPHGHLIYYKKTTEESLLTARVYDVANFVSTAVSRLELAAYVFPVRAQRNSFQNTAAIFMSDKYPDIQKNAHVIGLPNIRFSFLKKRVDHKFSVVNLVSGKRQTQFVNELNRSYTKTSLLLKKMRTSVHASVTLVDDESPGYRESEMMMVSELLDEISQQKQVTASAVKWSERRKISDYI